MLASDSRTARISYRFVGKNGEIMWLEDHFLASPAAELNHPEELIAYTANVTAKQEKERDILRVAEHDRKIIESLPEFIFIFDDHFFIRDVMIAPGKVTLLHPIDSLIGADGRTIYSPEVSELFLKNIRECLKEHKLKEIEYPLEVNGKCYYFQARIAPFEKNTCVVTVHDIGDRVRRSKELIEAKQKAEEADQMKSLFLANMSHEIRTPLNAIVGFSEIISLTEDEEERKEYFDIIKENSNLLLQLVNDILDLSRIESGKSEMHFRMVSLSKLMAEVKKTHQLEIPESIQLELVLPKEDISIYTDRNRLSQVLSNFMSNAIKNTTKGSITVGLAKEGEWVRLFVADTGCGISENKLPLIFDRFEKLNDFVQGTGLGLPICKNIVERLGGRIEVASEVGKGSTFSIYLHLNAASVITNQSEGTRRILVADRSETDFLRIRNALEQDYELIWAKDGEEVVDRFLVYKPDLILINMRLSKQNGAIAIEKIRKISASIPIVAVTEHSYYTEQQQAFHAGCDEIIIKPYSLDKLKSMIEPFFRRV